MNKKVLAACVFCGEPPAKRTEEHVIPKWLITLAKADDSQLSFASSENGKLVRRQQAAKSYWFPACAPCNRHYSTLEGEAKKVVESFVNRGSSSYGELTVLLDWLDKVRVGLWRGTLLRLHKHHGILPRFGITQRISAQDRIAKIILLDDDQDGYQIIGTANAAFLHTPSCFGLRIRNILIVSISAPSIIGRWVGLPYASYAALDGQDRVQVWIEPGGDQFMRPEILGFLDVPGITLLQPSVLAFLRAGMDPALVETAQAERVLADGVVGGVMLDGIDSQFVSNWNKRVPRHALPALPATHWPAWGAIEVLRAQLYLQRFRLGFLDVDSDRQLEVNESFDRSSRQLVGELSRFASTTPDNLDFFGGLIGPDGLAPNVFDGPKGIQLGE